MRKIGDLDFSDFPEKITLRHGEDGEREYWEYWKRKKGIVKQRQTRSSPYYIFFIDGEAVRTYRTPEIRAYKTIEEAIKDLKEFGIQADLFKIQ